VVVDNLIGVKGAKALANALEKNTTVQQMILSNNQIGVEGAKALASAQEKNTTVELIFDRYVDVQSAIYEIDSLLGSEFPKRPSSKKQNLQSLFVSLVLRRAPRVVFLTTHAGKNTGAFRKQCFNSS
jgi:hypothetical protein